MDKQNHDDDDPKHPVVQSNPIDEDNVNQVQVDDASPTNAPGSPARSLPPDEQIIPANLELDVKDERVAQKSAATPAHNAEVHSPTLIVRSTSLQSSSERSRKDKGIEIRIKERKIGKRVVRFRRFKSSTAPDPNLPPTCMECKKEFSSWPALYGHMRIHPNRDWRGIVRPPNEYTSAIPVSREDVEAAAGLLSLAFDNHRVLVDSADSTEQQQIRSELGIQNSASSSNARYECKGCKKVFTSFQALGGHRASHKSIKGCYAVDNSAEDLTLEGNGENRMHRCRFCSRVFATGQALGGHMRLHIQRIQEEAAPPSQGVNLNGTSLGRQGMVVDLNLPFVGSSSTSSSSSSSPDLDLHL